MTAEGRIELVRVVKSGNIFSLLKVGLTRIKANVYTKLYLAKRTDVVPIQTISSLDQTQNGKQCPACLSNYTKK